MATRAPHARTSTQAVATGVSRPGYLRFLLAGVYFGFVLIKAEVVSWYRIQEMFRFQSFHMYGVIGSAVVVGMISVWLIRRVGARALTGERIGTSRYPSTYLRYILGGTLFGLGWALTGACPGPILALVGGGLTVFLGVFASAVLGTWAYGWLKPRLPH